MLCSTVCLQTAGGLVQCTGVLLWQNSAGANCTRAGDRLRLHWKCAENIKCRHGKILNICRFRLFSCCRVLVLLGFSAYFSMDEIENTSGYQLVQLQIKTSTNLDQVNFCCLLLYNLDVCGMATVELYT